MTYDTVRYGEKSLEEGLEDICTILSELRVLLRDHNSPSSLSRENDVLGEASEEKSDYSALVS